MLIIIIFYNQNLGRFKDIGMFSTLPDGLPKLKKRSVENVMQALQDSMWGGRVTVEF